MIRTSTGISAQGRWTPPITNLMWWWSSRDWQYVLLDLSWELEPVLWYLTSVMKPSSSNSWTPLCSTLESHPPPYGPGSRTPYDALQNYSTTFDLDSWPVMRVVLVLHHLDQRAETHQNNRSDWWSPVINCVSCYFYNAKKKKDLIKNPQDFSLAALCTRPQCLDKKAPACSSMAHFYCWLRVLSPEWTEGLWENQARTLLTHQLVNSSDPRATRSLFISIPRQ